MSENSASPDDGLEPAMGNSRGNPEGNPWGFRMTLLVMSHLVGTLNIVSVLAMAPVISDDLKLSATQFGFFVTAYYTGQAFWSMPAGGLVDRFGVGKSLVISHIVMVSGALSLVLSPNYWASLFGLFLMGVGYSMTNPASARGVLAWFPPERRGTAMGIKQVGVPLGGVLAAGNGALAATIPWQTLMSWAAVLTVVNGVCCLYLLRFHRPSHHAPTKTLHNLLEVFKIPRVQKFTLLSGFLNFGQTNFFAFLTLFMREAAHASQPMAGFAIGVAQASSAFARIGWGAASDRWFRESRGVLMAWVCGAAAFLFTAMVFVEPGWGVWLGLALAFLLGLTIASFAPVQQAMMVEIVEPRLAGSAMGYNLTGVYIGAMIGPPVFGAVLDMSGTYDAAWLVTALMTGLGTLMLVVWFGARAVKSKAVKSKAVKSKAVKSKAVKSNRAE